MQWNKHCCERKHSHVLAYNRGRDAKEGREGTTWVHLEKVRELFWRKTKRKPTMKDSLGSWLLIGYRKLPCTPETLAVGLSYYQPHIPHTHYTHYTHTIHTTHTPYTHYTTHFPPSPSLVPCFSPPMQCWIFEYWGQLYHGQTSNQVKFSNSDGKNTFKNTSWCIQIIANLHFKPQASRLFGIWPDPYMNCLQLFSVFQQQGCVVAA